MNLKLELTQEEKKIILNTVHISIERYFKYEDAPDFKAIKQKHPVFKEKLGLFVTIHIGEALRGCIGTIIGDRPLLNGIYENARSSAFHDPRFSPLTETEYKKVSIEVTVLGPLIQVKDFSEIKIGRDGLYLKSGNKGGVFLPQVPIEQKWDLEQYLTQLLFKAGLPVDTYSTQDYILSRFEGLIIKEND